MRTRWVFFSFFLHLPFSFIYHMFTFVFIFSFIFLSILSSLFSLLRFLSLQANVVNPAFEKTLGLLPHSSCTFSSPLKSATPSSSSKSAKAASPSSPSSPSPSSASSGRFFAQESRIFLFLSFSFLPFIHSFIIFPSHHSRAFTSCSAPFIHFTAFSLLHFLLRH